MSGKSAHTGKTLWASAQIWVKNSNFLPAVCMIFLVMLILNAATAIACVVLSLRNKKSPLWPFFVELCTHIIMLAMNIVFGVTSSNVLTIISAILVMFATSYGFLCGTASFEKGNAKRRKGVDTRFKNTLSVIGGISILPVLSLFYVPICTYYEGGAKHSIVPMGAFSSGADNLLSLCLFVILFIFTMIDFTMLLNCLRNYACDDADFADKIRGLVNLNAIITGVYFVVGVIVCSFNNSVGKNLTTSSYIPLLIMTVLVFVCAFYARKVAKADEELEGKTAKIARIEFFIYGALAAIVTVIAAFSDIIQVTFTKPVYMKEIFLNGYDIFMDYNNIDPAIQMVAFLLFAILSIIVALFIASLVSFISKSKLFFKITLAELVGSAAFSLMIGLFGKYYEIVQKMNEELILSLTQTMVGSTYITFEYEVKSQAFYWFLIAMAIVVVALFRKPYSRFGGSETPVVVGASYLSGGAATSFEAQAGSQSFVADPCPAFTELDKKIELFNSETEERESLSFESPTLPGIVQFVVNYARDCRLHLSYTTEDIATFVAGLGATRLSILQGMSGTGKTSLPKIFSEAIMGNCEIIEVESSWRDKNELLGYYNEFSKIYTPKKFTQALYKARLNPQTITFIVLDEMNLSRIEYYFSDFLSLMENEEDKREIKLLNVGLCRTENGKIHKYAGLNDGHTIKVPNNVWFIGTANRDESTFEISDKVYDRAHTMNFNKRAVKPLAYGAPIPQSYISVDTFAELIEKAKNTVKFDIDSYPLIKEVEAILAPYNISFGNRIAKQIETFVSIYCSCFATPDSVLADAVEKILLSKVVSKLEFKSVENKTQLAAEFEKRKLYRCSEFILKLNED